MNKAQRMKGSMEKMKLEERPAGTGGAEPQGLAENLKFYSEPEVPPYSVPIGRQPKCYSELRHQFPSQLYLLSFLVKDI